MTCRISCHCESGFDSLRYTRCALLCLYIFRNGSTTTVSQFPPEPMASRPTRTGLCGIRGWSCSFPVNTLALRRLLPLYFQTLMQQTVAPELRQLLLNLSCENCNYFQGASEASRCWETSPVLRSRCAGTDDVGSLG